MAKNALLNPMFRLCRKDHSNSMSGRSDAKDLEHVLRVFNGILLLAS
jgi:hypothetical protein